jgi:hypothetical protein
MRPRQLNSACLVAAVVAAIAGGCQRAKTTAPELQTTTGVQPRMQPVSVTGCLRSGVAAADTFVLMATKPDTAGAEPTATFQLIGGDANALRAHVDEQVRVTGTVEAEQQIASTGTAAQEERAKGTSGTPTVSTSSAVAVKSLVVSAVTPTGTRCK